MGQRPGPPRRPELPVNPLNEQSSCVLVAPDDSATHYRCKAVTSGSGGAPAHASLAGSARRTPCARCRPWCLLAMEELPELSLDTSAAKLHSSRALVQVWNKTPYEPVGGSKERQSTLRPILLLDDTHKIKLQGSGTLFSFETSPVSQMTAEQTWGAEVL